MIMKKITKKTAGIVNLFIALILSLSLCTVLYAEDEQVMQHGHGPTGHKFGPPPGGHLLFKAINDNMASEVLVEITGKSLEEVKAEIESTHMMQVLENNSIDPETFKTYMDAKVAAAAEKAASCGLITAEQAAEISSQIN